MNRAIEGHSQPENDTLFVRHSGLVLEKNFSQKINRANIERCSAQKAVREG